MNDYFSILATKVYQLRWVLSALLIVLIMAITVLNQKVVAITVLGETQWLNHKELKSEVLIGLNSRWFVTSITDIKNTAEKVDWVDQVNVKRVWPSSLEITIKEQQPVACWNDQVLTNRSNLIKVNKCSPNWRIVKAGNAFIQRYQTLSPLLLKLEKKLGHKVTRIKINERGTWQMEASNKLIIIARNSDIEPRLTMWLKLITKGDFEVVEKVKKVDLRYPNGFSVEI